MGREDWEKYFAALKKQDWVAAKKTLQKISVLDKKNPRVFLNLGDVCRRTGEAEEAVAHYRRSALLLDSQGFTKRAIAVFKVILEIDPRNKEAIARSKELIKAAEAEGSAPLPPAAATIKAEAQAPAGETATPEKGLQAPLNIPDLFSAMSESRFRTFLSGLEVRRFQEKARVIEEGDSGDSMYLIRRGGARVSAHMFGKEIELARLRAGDVFGEVAFLTGRPRTATVTADGTLEVYEISRLALETIIGENPEVLAKMEDFQKSRARGAIDKIKKKN